MAKLDTYRAKRDFSLTPEPSGGDGLEGGSAFVIQKHAASRLHYDLRLELDGVMKSWAVAKGPSLDPGEKRLAVHVEDHPIEYNSFEGLIPKGQYGGGTVLLWDRGRWVPEGDPHKGYANGHLKFELRGDKLHGAWHLVRLRKKPGDWLLMKSHDDHARGPGQPDILQELPLSVESGRSLEEIAADRSSATWTSSREPEPPAPPPPARRRRAKRDEDEAGPKDGPEPTAPAKATPIKTGPAKTLPAKPGPKPRTKRAKPPEAAMPVEIEPALACLADRAPSGSGWWHEIKWDGYRLIAFRRAGKVRLATRRGLDWTARFPAIAEAIAALPVDTLVLDGEAIVEDETGRASFQALQTALSDKHAGVARDAVLRAFDLLYLDGVDWRERPLEERKERLAGLVPAGEAGALRLSEHLAGNGATVLRSACDLGLEGIISKRLGRPYRSGRSNDWVKTKCTDRQEFVVVGFVPSTAAQRAIGSLVLGYYEDGALRPAGRAGTGYSAETARDLWARLAEIRRAAPPLAERLGADERRGVTWVEPNLVAEIEFRGWTGDRRLRHAAFKGLREDKPPEEVVRETGEATSAPSPDPLVPIAGPTRRKALPEARFDVELTHPDRILWEDGGVTKQGLADYYAEVAEWALPHVVGRPLSLLRCPSGAGAGCFFQKHAWAGLHDRIRRVTVRDAGGDEEVLFVEDLNGIAALVQASVLEIHPWGATVGDVDRPDRLALDLDPGEGVAWPDLVAGALEVRERLAASGLESFVKTTGGKGLHVVVPLEPAAGWDEAKAFTRALAEGMEKDAPRRYVAKATKAVRAGLIYVDYLRNGRGATAVGAYSSRARPGAPVSVPLGWDELVSAAAPYRFDVASLPGRLRRRGRDPWRDLWIIRQRLPSGSGAGRTRRKPPSHKSSAPSGR